MIIPFPVCLLSPLPVLCTSFSVPPSYHLCLFDPLLLCLYSVHQDLTLQKFKRIFYMEYVHRMWGRLVGLAVLVPAAGFWACGYLDRPLKARAIIYGGLVLAQGLMGWWMVRSGLVTKPEPGDVPRVSQYRLASHLGLALLLYSSMFYTAIGILSPPTTTSAVKGVGRLRHVTHAAAGLVFLTALSGETHCTLG